MKVHEHSSTSVINREALELHTKRNLKLQLVRPTFEPSANIEGGRLAQMVRASCECRGFDPRTGQFFSLFSIFRNLCIDSQFKSDYSVNFSRYLFFMEYF